MLAARNTFDYNHTITPTSSEPTQTTSLVVFCLTLILLAFGFAVVWSNHFGSSFHLEDSHVIVTNRAIRSLSNIPRFFTAPRTFSARPEEGEYQPLLSTSFAVDYAIRRQLDPRLFQIENFLWFLLQLALMYALFRVIPGGTYKSAFFAVLLYGLHPLAAETVNYTRERGMIYSAIGVIAGLFLWIAWPRLLPPDFKLHRPRVPKNHWDLRRIRMRPRLSRWYRRIIGLPIPLYLFPVLLAMFAGPAGVAFVPILLIYILLFEPGTSALRAIPAAILFGGIWVFQTVVIWRLGGSSRIPLLGYLSTQPWVVLRYLYSFFLPVRLSAVTSLTPFPHLLSVPALAGYAGLAAVVWLACATGRRTEWRGVSFGLWWFLVALLPAAIIPQPEIEAFPRMFVAYAGLVLALARTAFILLERLERSPGSRAIAQIAAPVLGVLVLAACGWATYQRNEVWRSDETLWNDVLEKNPNDGRALMNYALTFMDPGASDVFGARYETGFDYLTRAAALLPRDAEVETQLGIACEQIGRDLDAEKHFRRALSLGPSYAPAWAAYSEWLLSHSRLDEASDAAKKAGQLDPVDVIGRRTLAEIYIQRDDWPNAVRVADEVLRIDPDDPGAQRSLHVAEAGIAANENTRTLAAAVPSVDNFLALSVVYYQERKYQECIQAAREALKIRPEAVEAYVNIAAAWHAMGKEDETIAALREALRLKPDLEIAKHNLEYELAHMPGAPQSR